MRHFLLALLALCLPFTAHAESRIATPRLIVTDARAFPPVTGMDVGVAYVTITNHYNEPRTLKSISGDVSKAIELHTHTMVKDIMQMRKLDALTIQPHETVTFAPGALHLMLIGLTEPLTVGETFPVTLHFDKDESVDVKISVLPRDAAKSHQKEADPHAEHHH